MKVGTKSLLFGAHAFWLHPFFVYLAWIKLYGFTLDIRVIIACILHDIGYVFSPNMDGPEGERHPELGARIMSFLFDSPYDYLEPNHHPAVELPSGAWIGRWGQFCLYHSRYYAKRHGRPVSRLCSADKLAFCLTPCWLYLPMVKATGEIHEYMQHAQKSESTHWTPTGHDARKWHAQLKVYMQRWVDEHKDGAEDTWTSKRYPCSN